MLSLVTATLLYLIVHSTNLSTPAFPDCSGLMLPLPFSVWPCVIAPAALLEHFDILIAKASGPLRAQGTLS